MLLAHGLAFRSTPAGGAALLLDGLATAPVLAVSMRKLRTAHAGSAIRVRRTSDSTQQDIGFSGTDLDTTALATFCASTDGYVVTWYDQSGNSRDLTQATTTLQMRIVSGGTIDVTAGGKPVAITPDTTDRGYKTATFTGYTGTGMAMAWCGVLSSRTGARMLSLVKDNLGDYNSAARCGFIRVTTTAQINHFRNLGNFAARAITDSALAAYGSRTDGTNAHSYTTTGTNAQGQTSAFDVNQIYMGLQENVTGRAGTGHKQCEAIVWLADPGATELTTVLSDQRTYWGAA